MHSRNFCVVPGIGFLEGLDIVMTAEFQPLQLRATAIECSSLRNAMPSVKLHPETAELTLAELVVTMQQAAATCPSYGQTHGDNQTKYQEMARREAHDFLQSNANAKEPPAG